MDEPSMRPVRSRSAMKRFSAMVRSRRVTAVGLFRNREMVRTSPVSEGATGGYVSAIAYPLWSAPGEPGEGGVGGGAVGDPDELAVRSGRDGCDGAVGPGR